MTDRVKHVSVNAAYESQHPTPHRRSSPSRATQRAVSPKEIWAIVDDQHVVVAHIASPQSVRNVAQQPLLAMTGERIPVHSVLVVAVQSVAPIVAPSYWRYPEETTEASQVASAMRTYGVRLR